jgi:hypothetical protein
MRQREGVAGVLFGIRPQDMIEGRKVAIAKIACGFGERANGSTVEDGASLREHSTDPHRRITTHRHRRS